MIPDEGPLKSETLDLILIKAINITKDSLVVVNLSVTSNIYIYIYIYIYIIYIFILYSLCFLQY